MIGKSIPMQTLKLTVILKTIPLVINNFGLSAKKAT